MVNNVREVVTTSSKLLLNPNELQEFDCVRLNRRVLLDVLRVRFCVTLSVTMPNRSFSKMAAENLNKSKLKTNTTTRKSTLTLVTLPSISISGEISAEKI